MTGAARLTAAGLARAETWLLLLVGIDFLWYWYHRMAHRVRLVYLPESFTRGRAVSALTFLLLAAAGVVWWWWKSR